MTLNTSGAPKWRTMAPWIAAILTVLIAAAALAMTPAQAKALATFVDLGTADDFAVLGGQSVTNTGPSVVIGDLGVSPGSSITGFGGLPDGTVVGTIHNNNGVAAQAQSDLTDAYLDAESQPQDVDLTGQDLGGMNLAPGVYHFDSSAQLTGDLTLDAGGDADAVWVFQIESTLTTASSSRVLLSDGAQPCNVFWQIGSSATLGSSTTFVGNILALTSISLNSTASIDGRALARNGSVTMINNTIIRRTCEAATDGGTDGGDNGGDNGGADGGSGS